MARAPNVQSLLSRRFRESQAASGTAAANAVERLWNAGMEIRDIRGSWARTRPSIIAVIKRVYAANIEAARTYYNGVRMANDLPVLPARYQPSIPLTDTWLSSTIDPAGPGMMMHWIGQGWKMQDAYDSARANLSSAVQRLVMTGARQWIQQASKNDPQSNGVQRVTSGTCDFCQSLADQGVQVALDGWHNNCQCVNEPAFGGIAQAAREMLPLEPGEAQAAEEAGNLIDTMTYYTDAEGNWIPERAALHDRIIGELLDGNMAQDQPEATFFGGGPASGKSALHSVTDQAVHIDADQVKAMLPEYRQMVANENPRAASIVHEESSYLSKQVQARAIENRYHFVLDGTGDSRYEKMASKVAQARDAGYTVHGRYVTVDTEEAVARARARAEQTGRMVPESVIRATHADVSRVYEQAARDGLYDSLELYDNNTPMGVPAELIARDTGTGHVVLNQTAYDSFLAKAQ